MLDGKVAIITGTGDGMGKATAELFAAEGARVVGLDYNGDSAAATAQGGTDAGGQAIGLRGDVTKDEDLDAAIAAAVSEFGGLDILVNNAGVLTGKGILDADWEEWDRVNAVNARALAVFTSKAAVEMDKRGGGAVVNVLSIAGIRAEKGGAAYIASKHAAVGLTRHCAYELAPMNIRVNAVLPGAVTSGMTRDYPAELLQSVVADNPLPRWGDPKEIATAVLFFASDMSSFATGASLAVDGGWSAR